MTLAPARRGDAAPDENDAPSPDLWARVARLWRTHWLFAILLTLGFVLRLVTWLAYRPALLYIDTFRYVHNLGPMRMDALGPIGYNLILKPMLAIGQVFGGGLAFTSAVQHLLGIGVALVLYRIARGLGSARWVSAIITAPILLDAYQLQIEQSIMTEIWSDALLVLVLWLLLDWRLAGRVGTVITGRASPVVSSMGPKPWQAALAGALIAANMSVRIIGIVVFIPFVLYLIFADARWRDRRWRQRMVTRLVAGLAGFALIFSTYVIAFRANTGYWGISGASSGVLYGRAATVAKCEELPLDRYLAQVCPAEPLDERLGVDAYTHGGFVPDELPPGKSSGDLKREFGLLVLREQPFDIAFAIIKDFFKGFAWVRTTSHNDVPLERWYFELDYQRWDLTDANAVTQRFDGMDPTVIRPFTAFLRAYQLSVGYTPGTLLGLAGLLGLASIFARRGRLRAEAMLTVGIPLILLGGAAAFEFSWRYQLPGLVFFPLAGAIGLTAFMGRATHPDGRGGSVGRRPPMAPYPDQTDRAAVAAFADKYGDVRFPDLVVVIAAFNEEKGIEAVLQRMPKSCAAPDGGEPLRVATLVVVDGATDNTAEVASRTDAYVCVAPKNRGQGGALRLGYHLARERGARFVATTDADGQYEIDELPELMRPILEDRADFVTGSRRLGHEEADSHMRWVGVRVFAILASVLTRQRITDTSFGFRAMRSEVAGNVHLAEPQYQASELLVGAIARGARVVEVPLTMRLRNSGSTKKGGSITYGLNYTRVMIGSWLREWFNADNRRVRQEFRKTNRSKSVNLSRKTNP